MVQASDRQSLFDVAVERLGSAEAAFALAMKNGLSITDVMTPGQPLEMVEVMNVRVADYYLTRAIKPVTGSLQLTAAIPRSIIPVTVVGSVTFVGDSIKASENQSLFDLAVERLGSAEAAFSLALKNGLSITDALTPGQTILLADVIDADVSGYFTSRAIRPATAKAETTGGGELVNEGIGYWAIGIDFIVS